MGILVAGELPSLRGRVSAPDQEAVSFASIAVKGGRAVSPTLLEPMS